MKEILAIMVLVAVLFVSVQYAQADERILMIEGQNKDHGIFIAIEGNSNIIMWETLDGYSEHFDGKLKTYKSGGFSLKNLKSGIAVWGHPIEDATQYKLVIFTSEGVERMTASVMDYTPLEETENKSGPTRVEPKSSVGTDITKWNIPTTGRSVSSDNFLLAVETGNMQTKRLGEDLVHQIKVYEVRHNQKLEGARVTLEISRDNFVHKSVTLYSDKAGLVDFDIRHMEYPLFYPNFCYDVKIMAEYEGYTTIVKDDFTMLYNGAWSPDLSWIDEDEWDYLPKSFEDEPRERLLEDSYCN